MKQELLQESLEHFPLAIDALLAGWSIAFIADIAQGISPGFACGKHDSNGNGHPHMRPMNIDRTGRIDLTVVKSVPSPEGRTLSRGDILFNNTNSPDLVGKTALIGARETGFAFSNHMTRIRVDENMSPDYVAHYLQFLWMSGYMKHRCTNHVNQASISSKTLAQTVPLLVPPASEQLRIVEKLEELLSDLEAGVAELKAAQRKLVQYRKSLLMAAVGGTLTADWRSAHRQPQETGAELLQRILSERRARWEQERIAKFAEQGKAPPKDWQAKYLEPVAPPSNNELSIPEEWIWSGIEQLAAGTPHALKAGPFGSSLKKEFYTSNGYKVYGQEQVIRGDANFGDYFVSEGKYQELISCATKPGDLLISLVGTTGKILVLPPDARPGIINPRLLKVSLSPGNVCPDYIQMVLESPYARQFFKLNAHGETMDVLNLGILKELAIPLPAFAEQEIIVLRMREMLEEIERQESAIVHALKQVAAQRKNILKAAFAGQLVPKDPHDEPASALLARIRAQRASNNGSEPRRRRKTA